MVLLVLPVVVEYFQAKQDDSESLNQLMCHLALEGHPMNKFFWGNEKTLKDNPRKQVWIQISTLVCVCVFLRVFVGV